MTETRLMRCCGCNGDKVEARLTNGAEIYPHRPDLHNLPFWKCDACGNFVGCHHKTADRTRPLGCIPTPELKQARQQIHRLIDPYWKAKRVNRSALYAAMSEKLGWKYHTAMIRSVDEAREVYRVAQSVLKEMTA